MAPFFQRQELRGKELRPEASPTPGLRSPGPQLPLPLSPRSPSHHPLEDPASISGTIQLTKRPKWMDCPSSMCRSAWAPLRREMTDWQPGSRDRSSPEPVMWSAWQWVFTGRQRRPGPGGHRGDAGLPAPALPPSGLGVRPRLTSIQQPQPQLLDQLGVPRRGLQNRVDQNGLSGLSVTQEVRVSAALGLKHLGRWGGQVRAQNQTLTHWGPGSPGLHSTRFLRSKSRNPTHFLPLESGVREPSNYIRTEESPLSSKSQRPVR